MRSVHHPDTGRAAGPPVPGDRLPDGWVLIMPLTIRHTPTDGSTIDIVDENPVLLTILTECGWYWDPTTDAWYLAGSRGAAANVGIIGCTVGALRTAGLGAGLQVLL